jgi:CP family cyanate transporter-like MFS transporter
VSATQRRPTWVVLLALALVAVNLRAVLTAIPPLTEQIQAETGWSDTTIGLLTTLPLIVMGLAALIVPAVAARLGRTRAVSFALILLIAASGLRLLAIWPWTLFITTVLAGLGIAIATGLVPGIVREQLPRSTGAATGLWTSIMFVGATLAAALTIPLALLTGSWPVALAVWALPAVAGLVVWTLTERSSAPAAESGPRLVRITHLPWRDAKAWALTAYIAINSIIFYTALAWVAPSLEERGWSAEASGGLFGVFAAAPILAAVLLPWLGQRIAARRTLWVATAIATVVPLLFLAYAPHTATLAMLFIFGFANSGGFTISLSMLSEFVHDAAGSARLTAMAFTVTFLLAAAGPALAGMLLDLTQSWTAVYVILAVIALTQIPPMIPLRKGTLINA